MAKNINKSSSDWTVDPVSLLQRLIQFNTTNPPGKENSCINYIKDLLREYGIESQLFEEVSGRPNLIARLKGNGITAPLLVYGHVDVVTTEKQQWKYDPFHGIIAEDCVWGRGAMDMKGAVSMMISSLIQLKVSNTVPPGDIIMAIVSDEEVGNCGSKFMVKVHPELFKDVKYAIGEFGGFTMFIEEKKFYPIMISEKQVCSLKVTFRGKNGHGSIPQKNGAMAKVGNFLKAINDHNLPVHITIPARGMVNTLSKNLPFPKNLLISQLSNPFLTDIVLNLMGATGVSFNPIFHNSVSATIIHGGHKINVIPSEVELTLDGRLLPGQNPDDLIKELKTLDSFHSEFQVVKYVSNNMEINMGMFHILSSIIKELDPNGIPMPLLVSGTTDARFFASLGITTYGFTPMLLDKSFNFTNLMHSENERIPLKAVYFGTSAIFKLMKTFI